MRFVKLTTLFLQASIIVSFLAGSIAPTPLYVVYQAAWRFSPITITVIFGVYAIAVLLSLLLFGSLSDYIGRKPVLIATLLVQLFAMALFAIAKGVPSLLVARVVQGLATGAAAGAVGAGMLDIDRPKGTIANAVAPALGTASGGLLSGVFVQYLPAPTQLIYLSLGAVFILQVVLVLFMPETVTRRAGALASLRPHLSVPPHIRGSLVIAAPALIGTWALAGFYGALGPSIVRKLSGSHSLVLGGLVVFAFAGTGALVTFLSRSQTASRVMQLGAVALFVGVALALFAIARRSTPWFFVASVVAGAGFGGGFQGAIRTVVPLASPNERAGVLSVVWILAYLSMAVPAVLGGFRIAHVGLPSGAHEYGLAVMALAALALAGSLWRRRDSRARSPTGVNERAG